MSFAFSEPFLTVERLRELTDTPPLERMYAPATIAVTPAAATAAFLTRGSFKSSFFLACSLPSRLTS